MKFEPSVDASKKTGNCHWDTVACDRDAVACPQLSLGARNNSLCPFQIPSRKAIACIGGMLTLLATAVPLVFDGLLLEHHPKDSRGALSFLKPMWLFPTCCHLQGWLLQFKSSTSPGKHQRSFKLTLEQAVSDNRTRETKETVETAMNKDNTLLCGFVV